MGKFEYYYVIGPNDENNEIYLKNLKESVEKAKKIINSYWVVFGKEGSTVERLITIIKRCNIDFEVDADIVESAIWELNCK